MYDAVGPAGAQFYDGVQMDNVQTIRVGIVSLGVLFGCIFLPLFLLQLVFIPFSLQRDLEWSAGTTLVHAT